ncbi:MAG: class I SAM-dependent methyltransferase [Candidatus Aureabacteria bacterium]|jgi:hypothetical protein|nr:class I SAM-dependent methyltransferase [Candidatus Auribacterota bacterium]NLW94571.1 class I SAM-dependent methyltransferase [Chlamydiota bacterium]HOE26713.1 class I SAM-dependent methyltransferase [bacterium]HQM51712.1 class I SAM-dependent methyltransferase [bacterium]
MVSLSGMKSALQRYGVQGALAGALRRAADLLTRNQMENSPETQRPNDFLAWVRFAVPGMLRPGNIDAMDYAIAHMPPGGPIVEIGSFCGLSTVVLSYLLEKHSRTTPIFSCDKWEFEGQQLGAPLGDSTSVTHDVYQVYVKETFLRTMHTFASSRLPYTINCFSDEFFLRWFAREMVVDVFGRSVTLGGEISFSYIDGNHTYAFAKRDFENTDRVLVSGGFILFDDSSDDSTWEVNRLTREIAAGQRYELISKTPNYLFRKR